MSLVLAFVLGIAVTVVAVKAINSFWSFQAQSLSDYAGPPTPALGDVLGGKFQAHGLIFDYSGRAKSRFTANIEGAFDAEGGVLREHFSYASGADDRRQWDIRFGPDGRTFTATAADVIGEGKGAIEGDAIRMTYRLQLPERAGGHVLDVVDWLYLMPDGTIVNRSEMRKFGVLAAELMAVFTPAKIETAARVLEAAE